MPTQFDLIITADYPNRNAEFRLLDAHGGQLAYRQTDFKTITTGHLRGLFDLRNYLRVYVEEGREVAAVAEIGVCIAEEVLGQEIFEKLWQPESQRTLRSNCRGRRNRKTTSPPPWPACRGKSLAPSPGQPLREQLPDPADRASSA